MPKPANKSFQVLSEYIPPTLKKEIDNQIITSDCLADTQNIDFIVKLRPHEFKKQIEITTKTNSGDIIMSVYNNSSSQKKFSIIFPQKVKIYYDSIKTVVTTSDTNYRISNDQSVEISLAQHDLLMFTLKTHSQH